MLEMARFHYLFLCRYVKLLKLHIFNARFIHDVKNVNGSDKPFNSLEKLKWLRNSDYDWENSSSATRICLTVVGNGAVGQPRCLCMFTDCKSYMFNCGEGSIRLTKEQDLSLLNLRQVFITEKKWENLSGIADLYLSHQTCGVRKLTLHGPPGIENFQHVVSAYKSLRLGIKTIDDSPFVDDTIEVEYVPIHRKNFASSRTKRDNMTGSSSGVVCYICKIRNSLGNFSSQKCIDLGVPLVGQLFLDLKNGEDLILPSGKHVKSSDVREESQPGFTFLVVDCPYETLINDFISEKKFEKYHSSSSEEQEQVIAVFHFSPQYIVQSYKYQQWISRFPSTTLHFLLNSSNSSLSSKVVHQIQHTLNLLHPRIFPLLHEKPLSDVSGLLESNENIIHADANLQLYVRPELKIDRSNVVQLSPEEYVRDAKKIPGFCEHISALRKSIEKKSATLPGSINEQYPEVIFLGTGSSTSSAYRNVTGILVNISPENSILLDCGEGIYSQMMRYFGYHSIGSVLRKISGIFISHHHTDHYLGMFQLLKARKEAFFSCSEPYRVPAIMHSHFVKETMKNYSKCFEPIMKRDIRLFNNKTLMEDYVYDPLKEYIGDIKVLTVPVEHCAESYGVVLSSQNWKIVYSGDAVPSQALIDAGKDCTLLIHEASVEDDFSNEAAQKKHSTPSQVVEVAEQMNAEHVILTHFSKRYLAVPLFPKHENPRIGCAFDNMSVRLSDLPILPLFMPSLKCLFSEWLIQHHELAVTRVCFDKSFFRSLKS